MRNKLRSVSTFPNFCTVSVKRRIKFSFQCNITDDWERRFRSGSDRWKRQNCFFYISNFEDNEKGGIVSLIARTGFSRNSVIPRVLSRLCKYKLYVLQNLYLHSGDRRVVNPLGPFLPKCNWLPLQVKVDISMEDGSFGRWTFVSMVGLSGGPFYCENIYHFVKQDPFRKIVGQIRWLVRF